MYSLKQITKNYVNGKQITEVLKGIDLDIAEGDFLAIMGSSGAGKTTLINILTMIEDYDEGEISFFAKSFRKYKDNFICAAQKELGVTVADNFLPLVIRIAVLHLGQILKDAGNAEIPASDYTDFLIQFQDSSGVSKLISQYMYSNRKFSFFSIFICISDQFDEDEGHKQGR